jgi:hypothetical protein
MMRVMLIVLVIPLAISCSGTETPETVNQAPTIHYTATEIVVDKRRNARLTVSVSDPDGDPLTLSWQITSGTLSDGSSSTEKIWDPPNEVGTDTLTVTVSDGDLKDSVTEIIKRGTRETADMYGNWRFRKADSPLILDPPAASTIQFTTNANETVTIEPGVEIYVNVQDLAIEVRGTLESIGTQADTILIRPNDRTLRCGDGRGWWEGLRAKTEGPVAGRINMEYTQVSYGVRNIFLQDGDASANLKNCRLVCSRDAAIEMASRGTLLVDNCDISSNRTHGIDISSLSTVPASVTITNNFIRSNGHTGINMELRDVSQAADITIERNEIKLNSIHGIAMTNAVWATIQHNDFILNNLANVSNIWLETPFPDAVNVPADWDTLLAINNYWSRAYNPGEIGLIEDTVEDRSDNPALGTYVIVDPWQNTPQANQ